jgi:ribonuclease HI
MSMLEEKYPSESWVRVYTATNTTTKGGAGIYIQYLNGDQQSEAIATGLHCSNYNDEGEDIIHTAHTIECKVDNNIQVVFLTDALSVLQPLMNDNLPHLEQALFTIKTIRTLLQWIPSHCGVHSNEQVDRLCMVLDNNSKKTQPASQR